MSSANPSDAAAPAADVSQMFIVQDGDWATVSTPSRHYFSVYMTTTDWNQDSVECIFLALVSKPLFGKYCSTCSFAS